MPPPPRGPVAAGPDRPQHRPSAAVGPRTERSSARRTALFAARSAAQRLSARGARGGCAAPAALPRSGRCPRRFQGEAPGRASVELKGFRILESLRPTETRGRSKEGKNKADKCRMAKSFYDSEGLLWTLFKHPRGGEDSGGTELPERLPGRLIPAGIDQPLATSLSPVLPQLIGTASTNQTGRSASLKEGEGERNLSDRHTATRGAEQHSTSHKKATALPSAQHSGWASSGWAELLGDRERRQRGGGANPGVRYQEQTVKGKACLLGAGIQILACLGLVQEHKSGKICSS